MLCIWSLERKHQPKWCFRLMSDRSHTLIVKHLGCSEYLSVWEAMCDFTSARTAETQDELWLLEHAPVFTQGQAGKPDHILSLGDDIPLVHSDRGGQVTYHGPGQLIAYPLLDIRRLGLGVRDLVTVIEASVIELLSSFGVCSEAKKDAPGVYVGGAKIASLGLRVRHARSFHGVAINFDMDLSPFERINPCGYPGLQMTMLSDLIQKHEMPSFESFQLKYAMILARALGYQESALKQVPGRSFLCKD